MTSNSVACRATASNSAAVATIGSVRGRPRRRARGQTAWSWAEVFESPLANSVTHAPSLPAHRQATPLHARCRRTAWEEHFRLTALPGQFASASTIEVSGALDPNRSDHRPFVFAQQVEPILQ